MSNTTTSCAVDAHIDALLHEIIAVRHDLHAHPELGYKETRTSKIIQDFLEKNEIQHKGGLAKGTGVLAYIQGEGEKSIGLRADMDALPIVEENTFDWKSVHEGCMHACGVDAARGC